MENDFHHKKFKHNECASHVITLGSSKKSVIHNQIIHEFSIQIRYMNKILNLYILFSL